MKILLTFLLASSLLACSKSGKTGGPDDSDPGKGVITGKITDQAGKPIANVKVYANHDTWFNTVAIAVTDANGNYNIDLKGQPAGSWSVNADFVKNFNGTTLTFHMEPENTDPITTNQGGVRNMVWKLTGLIPGSTDDTRLGGYVPFFTFSDEIIPMEQIELTFVPQGPLVDGSAGQTIVKKAEHFPTAIFGMYNNSGVRDIPVGRYKVTARYLPASGNPKAMLLAKWGDTNFQSSVITDFFQEAPSRFQQMVLEIKL